MKKDNIIDFIEDDEMLEDALLNNTKYSSKELDYIISIHSKKLFNLYNNIKNNKANIDYKAKEKILQMLFNEL